jgi:hypothetical protein
MSTACLYQACICHYTACIGCSETAGCILGCREKGEMCCCGSESCCYPGGESHGMCACKETQNTEFCRFAPMPCCECFCKSPQVCSKGYTQYCCIYNVSSCPFDKVCLCTICPHAPATRSYGHTVIRSYGHTPCSLPAVTGLCGRVHLRLSYLWVLPPFLRARVRLLRRPPVCCGAWTPEGQ